MADSTRPDALALYMRSVGEVPLLTPAQETELAARIRRGDEAARDWIIRAVEKTLEEIGALMRLTRERIRQLQNVALKRLRRLMEERDCVSTAA